MIHQISVDGGGRQWTNAEDKSLVLKVYAACTAWLSRVSDGHPLRHTRLIYKGFMAFLIFRVQMRVRG